MDRRFNRVNPHNFPWPPLRQWLQRGGCCFSRMVITTASSQSIGSWIQEGAHKPFRALACPLISGSRIRRG